MRALTPVLPYLDIFMPSEAEARRLAGRRTPRQLAEFFQRRGVGCFVLKQGARGSYARDARGREIRAPAFRVPVRDATGAGDCFCAGFLKGFSLGLSLGECLILGNAAGACAVSALGATTGLRSFAQLRRLVQRTKAGEPRQREGAKMWTGV